MDEILQLNTQYFKAHSSAEINLISVEQIIKKLNKHKIVKIRGLYHSEKTATAYKVVSLMGELQNCFYFNSQIYKNSRIKSAKGIKKLLEHAAEKKAVDTTSILVFESIEDIKHAKDVLSELFQEGKYKIILIGTLKHLAGLPHVNVEVPAVTKTINLKSNPEQLDNYFSLGSLYEFDYSNRNKEQLQIRDMLKDSCFLQDIIMGYGIKDIFLFQTTLNFLARNIGDYLSLRDITKLLNDGNLQTSVITITDYVNNSLEVGLLHKLKKFDLKKDKKMDSKGSYYFGDLGILASIKKDVPTKKYRLFENTLYLEMIAAGYELYSGVNGKFNFSFYTKKLGEKRCIHVSTHTDKKEIKKEINKLAKIHGKSQRYLVVESLDDLGLRKKDYQQVQLVTFIEMLQLI